MNIFKNLKSINDDWFYSDPHPLLRLLTIYVKGDAIAILPIIIGIGLLGFISVKFMLVMFGVFYMFRGLGEMLYWFLQQFGKKTYRPDDLGYKNLGNDAIYIMYQLRSLTSALVGAGLILWVLMFS